MGTCGIKRGTKMQLAKETTAWQQPVFDMITTFYKELDESAFLVSVPMARYADICIIFHMPIF